MAKAAAAKHPPPGSSKVKGSLKVATRCVHAGEGGPFGAVNVPVYNSTTFRYPELPDGSKSGHIYSRQNNPTVQAVETKLAALEGGASLLFGSGMAATAAVFQQFLHPGATLVIQHGLYGGTTAFVADEILSKGTRVVTAHEPSEIPDGAALVWMESITNPLLRVADVDAWAKAARGAGAALGVDATFASPMLQRPLERGATLSMHSASKYLGGHSDILAGAVTAKPELRDALWLRRRNHGAILDPQAAYLLGRGMKTLHLRVRAQCANAQALAEIARDAGVPVHYPGISDHPDYATAKRMLDGGFGGVLTLDVGSLKAAQAFRRALKVMVPAASLGGVDTLACLPIETSHAYADAAQPQAEGITDGLVRIACGIEDIEDLQADLERGLRGAR
jgi:methionine-gamma-lyase